MDFQCSGLFALRGSRSVWLSPHCLPPEGGCAFSHFVPRVKSGVAAYNYSAADPKGAHAHYQRLSPSSAKLASYSRIRE